MTRRNPPERKAAAEQEGPGTLFNLPAGHRDGATYDPALDYSRLGKQARAVFEYMQSGEWRTLEEISAATGYPEASVSARLRDFRKERFGGMQMSGRRRSAGLWEYRLSAEPLT